MDMSSATTAEIAVDYMRRSQVQIAAASLGVIVAARRLTVVPGYDAPAILDWVERALRDAYQAAGCEPTSIAAGLRGES